MILIALILILLITFIDHGLGGFWVLTAYVVIAIFAVKISGVEYDKKEEYKPMKMKSAFSAMFKTIEDK